MSRFHSLQIASVTPETRDAIAVSFVVPEDLESAFRFVQGQHLTLRMVIDGHEVRRSYSICSATQDAHMRIAIKRVAGGFFSNWANDHLKAGASVEMVPPSGHFHVALDASQARHYLAIAAGSGITPIFSIVKTTLAAEPASRVTLVYANRASSTVLFRDELADLKDAYLTRFNLIHVLSREQQEIDLFNGRINQEKMKALLDVWIDPSDIDAAFVCGPLGMMEAVREALRACGVEAARIKIERFATSVAGVRPPVHVHRVEGTNTCAVTVVQEGRTRYFTMSKGQESVLDAALTQGIELPYSCKAGVCSTCRCKRIRGEVDMDVNFALEDYEVARGFMLACQSFPVSDELIVDFDQEV